MQPCRCKIDSGEPGPSEVGHVGQVSESAVDTTVQTPDRAEQPFGGGSEYCNAQPSDGGHCRKSSGLVIDISGEKSDRVHQNHSFQARQYRL